MPSMPPTPNREDVVATYVPSALPQRSYTSLLNGSQDDTDADGQVEIPRGWHIEDNVGSEGWS
jgi:hypothetical protein